MDFTSGAANATAEMLRLLADLSFRCHAFCGGRFHVPREVTLGEALARRDWPFESQKVAWGGSATTIIKTMLEGTRGRQPAVPMTIFRTQSSRGQMGRAKPKSTPCWGLMPTSSKTLRLDLLMTYGGDRWAETLISAGQEPLTLPLDFSPCTTSPITTPRAFALAWIIVCRAFADCPDSTTGGRIGLGLSGPASVSSTGRGSKLNAPREPRFLTFINPPIHRKGPRLLPSIAEVPGPAQAGHSDLGCGGAGALRG